MRYVFIGAATAAVLTFAAGLYALPVHAADRNPDSVPVRLAQSNNPNMFGLLQDIQRLREQVRRLRGEVETLKYQIQRNQDSRQRMYERFDERLSALESGSGAGTGNSTDTADVDLAYQEAFGLLREGKYNEAISGFEAFVESYPDSDRTSEALYWLGQARYVQGDLAGATTALQRMIEAYPQSGQVPSALFRIGVVQQTEGKEEQAKATFQRIIEQYPDSDIAAKAQERL